jgi:hypothetical protein
MWQLFAVPAPDQPARHWHVSPAVDLAAYAFSWLWVLVPMLLLGDAKNDYIGWFILIMIVSDVHRHYTIPYIYGDSQVRRQYPLRFTLFPLVLLGVFVASPWLGHQKLYLGAAQLGAGLAFLVLLFQILRRDGGDRAPGGPTLALALLPTYGAAAVLTLAGLDPGGPLARSTWWFAAALLGSTWLDVEARRSRPTPRYVGPALILALVVAVTLLAPGLDARTRHGGIAALTVLNSLAAAAFVWNIWHSYSQKYGILRMYSAKSGADLGVPGWADRLFVFAWVPLYFAWLGPHHEATIYSWLGRGKHLLEPLIAGLRAVAWITVPLAIVWLVAAVGLWCVQERRASRLRSAPRLWMALGTFTLGATFFVFDPVKAFLAFTFSHALEYMVFVWAFQRRRYARPLAHDPPLQRILRRPALAYLGFTLGLGLTFLYWKYWGRHIGKGFTRPSFLGYDAREWLMYWAVYSSMSHFYWDGFLWKMRVQAIRQNL